MLRLLNSRGSVITHKRAIKSTTCRIRNTELDTKAYGLLRPSAYGKSAMLHAGSLPRVRDIFSRVAEIITQCHGPGIISSLL